MTSGARLGLGRFGAQWVLLPVAGLVAMQAAWAQVQEPLEPVARLEVSASPPPRPEVLDAAAGRRIDLTLLPPARSAVGLAVGMSNFGSSPALTGAGLTPFAQPSVDVGVRWRHTLESNHRIDFTAWRRLPQSEVPLLAQERQATYGARVELNLNPASPGKADLDSARHFVGMQLDNGARISIRRKHGGPMVYYRVKFY
jgi:hypothetical protein